MYDKPELNRRGFNKAVVLLTGGGTAAGVIASGVWGWTAYSRHRLATELVTEANLILATKSQRELNELPTFASEEIRVWFHSACLNSAEFIELICSDSFANKLSFCRTEEEKTNCVVNAFIRKVVSAEEIMKCVLGLAQQIDARLNQNWIRCCADIEHEWSITFGEDSRIAFSTPLREQLEPSIRAELNKVIASAEAMATRPALASTLRQVSAAALMVIRTAPKVGIPVFVLAALASLYSYVNGKIGVLRLNEKRRAFSTQLADLANRVAAEFQSDVRNQIIQLQRWQENALSFAAKKYARKSVNLS